MSSTLKVRLNRHFAACAAMATAAVVTGAASQSQGAIVYSGLRNIPIPANIDGVYVNVITGATGTSAGAVPGYDINPYAVGTGASFFTNAAAAADANQRGYLAASPTGAALNLAPGAAIDSLGTYNTGASAGTNFMPTSEGLVGFRFKSEVDNLTHFGWARLRVPTGSSATPPVAGVLVDWAYDDQAGVGIGAGNIPTPGAAGLLAAGALGGLRRRRR